MSENEIRYQKVEDTQVANRCFSGRTLPTQTKENASTSDSEYLPPKSFASNQKPKWKRTLWQTSIGITALCAVCSFSAIFVIPTDVNQSDPYLCGDGSSTLFSLDSAYGNWTLSQAKLVDVSFNLLAGRGLQGILAYFSYITITSMLLRAMENAPVTFDLYAALVFAPSSVYSIWPVAKAIITLPGIRPKFMMIWILYSCIFLLALPTLIDTMTGYAPQQDIFWKFPDSTIFSYPSSNMTQRIQLVKEHGDVYSYLCMPSKNGMYQWGFSIYWLIISWIFTAVWLLGTYVSWMDAQHQSELCQKGRSMNVYRASVDIAGAMEEVLGGNMDAYSGSELEKQLQKKNGIMYTSEANDMAGLGRLVLRPGRRGRMGKLSWNTLYGREKEA